jgi:hypothetical protein
MQLLPKQARSQWLGETKNLMGKIIAFTPDGRKTKLISKDGQTGVLNKEFEGTSLSVAWHGSETTAAKVFYGDVGQHGVDSVWIKPNGNPVPVSDEVFVVHKSPKSRSV